MKLILTLKDCGEPTRVIPFEYSGRPFLSAIEAAGFDFWEAANEAKARFFPAKKAPFRDGDFKFAGYEFHFYDVFEINYWTEPEECVIKEGGLEIQTLEDWWDSNVK